MSTSSRHRRQRKGSRSAEDLLVRLAVQIRTGLLARRRQINASTGRFPKRQLFLALNDCKSMLEREFGGPVSSRWSVGKRKKPSDTQVLEYLVDYGICRFSIPQAIRQPKRNATELLRQERYEILLAVESELGDDIEVARDFLKLLDVRSCVKSLFFRKRPDEAKTAALYQRLNWVMTHHRFYNPQDPILLVALPKAKTATLDDDLDFRCVRNGHAGAELAW